MIALESCVLEDSKETMGSLTPIAEYISDGQLCVIAFVHYLERVIQSAVLLDDSEVHRVKCVTQILLDLLKKSSHCMRRRFARFVADKLEPIAFSLQRLCTGLESDGKLNLWPNHNYLLNKIIIL